MLIPQLFSNLSVHGFNMSPDITLFFVANAIRSNLVKIYSKFNR